MRDATLSSCNMIAVRCTYACAGDADTLSCCGWRCCRRAACSVGLGMSLLVFSAAVAPYMSLRSSTTLRVLGHITCAPWCISGCLLNCVGVAPNQSSVHCVTYCCRLAGASVSHHSPVWGETQHHINMELVHGPLGPLWRYLGSVRLRAASTQKHQQCYASQALPSSSWYNGRLVSFGEASERCSSWYFQCESSSYLAE